MVIQFSDRQRTSAHGTWTFRTRKNHRPVKLHHLRNRQRIPLFLYVLFVSKLFKLKDPVSEDLSRQTRCLFTRSSGGIHYQKELPLHKVRKLRLKVKHFAWKPRKRPQRVRGLRKKDREVNWNSRKASLEERFHTEPLEGERKLRGKVWRGELWLRLIRPLKLPVLAC